MAVVVQAVQNIEHTILLNNETKIEIDKLKKTSEFDRNGLYLFVSFDLDNSTLFKSKATTNWPNIIMYFYEIILNNIKNKIEGISVWKYLGDEVIFYYRIKNIEKTYNVPEIVFDIQSRAIEKMKKEFRNANILDIKCTIWIAATTRVESKSIEKFNEIDEPSEKLLYRNIYIPTDSNSRIVEDFLGPDMDIGFRIAECSNKRKITLSAEYAYLLYQIDKEKLGHLPKITDKLKVVALEELKGVWEGRSYPIIWYYPDWDNCEKSFDYDEDIKNEIIKNISGKKNIDFLEKVYEDTGRKEYMKDFIEICKRYNDDGTTELVLGE